MLTLLALVVVLYILISSALFGAMLQTPDHFARTMKHVPWPAFVVFPFKLL